MGSSGRCTTSKGTTRWRCTHCNASFTRSTQPAATHVAEFRAFIRWATNTNTHSLNDIAADQHLTARTLQRRFTWCWYIQVPHTPDPARLHDQVFIDGTYLAGGCLLIAADTTHIIDWHWCRHETTTAYTDLLTSITAPLLVTTDGGQGAQSAIKTPLAHHESAALPGTRPTSRAPPHHQQTAHTRRHNALPPRTETDPHP